MKEKRSWPDKNPWLGLKTYDEDSRLYGRNQDIWTLDEIISNNIALVIFGKSGIGKSSLIHAGISPVLRSKDKLPVYIRFDHNTDESYIAQIIRQIKTITITTDRLDSSVPNMGLWDFFHRHEFKNREGTPIEPVLILDQFEEIFTLADSDHKFQAIELFEEMADLLNNVKPDKIIKAEQTLFARTQDETKTPAKRSLIIRIPTRNQLDYDFESKFHVVICIREDYLFYLERNTSKIPALKINRYSLHAFSKENAKQVINGPCPNLFDEKQCDDIINKLATMDDDGVIEIDPTLLSIYLYKYYNNRGFLETDNIIEDFYNTETQGISQKSLSYLEEKLITGEGFRQSIPCNDIYSAGVSPSEISSLVSSRIITVEPKRGHDYIEFSHDVLCPIAKEHREKRIIKIEAQRLRRRLIGSTILFIIGALLIGSFVYLNKRVIEGERSLKVMQTKNAASRAHYMIVQGDVLNAIKLLINTAQYDNEQDMVLPETELTLNEAFDSLYSSYSCIAILKHSDDVSTAEFTDDGNSIVTACADGVCRIWSGKSGELREELIDENCLNSASISKDNKKALCTLKDGTIIVWDVRKKEIINTIKGHKATVNYACFSPDSKYILSCSDDGTVKLWDSQTARLISTIIEHEDQVLTAVFSNDGKKVISASADGSSVIYDLTSHIGEVVFKDENTTVEYAEFNSNNSRIAIVTSNAVYILDAKSGQRINKLQGHKDIITSASFSPDGSLIVTSSYDKTLKLWDVESAQEIHTYIGHSNIVKDVVFSPDGRFVLSTSRDNEARLWNTVVTRDEDVINTGLSTLASVTYSPNGKYIAAISVMGEAKIWDSQNLGLVSEFRISELANSIVFNNNSDKVVVTADCNQIRVFDVSTGNMERSYKGIDGSNYNYALFTNDDKAIIAISPDNKAVKINQNGNMRDFITSTDSNNLTCVCQIPPQNLYLVSAVGQSRISLWNESSGRFVKAFDIHSKDICSIRLSHNQDCVVSTSSDNTAIISNLATGEVLHKLIRHSSQVSFAEFSPNDDYVITLSTDGTAKLWNVNSGEMIATRKSDAPRCSFIFNPSVKNQYIIVRNQQIVKNKLNTPRDIVTKFEKLYDNYAFSEAEKDYYSIK